MQTSVKRVGIIGGGQLAWMMGDAAQKLDLDLLIQTPAKSDPAVTIAKETIFAAVDDGKATADLATRCDVITFENEFIDWDALHQLALQGVVFHPSLEAIAPLLDKYQQRGYLEDLGLPVPKFFSLEGNAEGLESDTPTQPLELQDLDFPCVLKARRYGYDGQGTFVIHSKAELESIWQKLDYQPVLIEEFIPFEKELAVMAARSTTGEVVVYPVVETQQENQVCRRVFAPVDVSPEVVQQVERIGQTLLEALQVVGIYGIELFLTRDGRVLINEIAPRTHNSGHYTLDACETSQFEQQLRAVSGLPLGSPAMTCPQAVMVNLLGYEVAESDYFAKRQQLAAIPGAVVRWYGKNQSRPGRKLGHVTVLLEDDRRETAEAIAQQVESLWYNP